MVRVPRPGEISLGRVFNISLEGIIWLLRCTDRESVKIMRGSGPVQLCVSATIYCYVQLVCCAAIVKICAAIVKICAAIVKICAAIVNICAALRKYVQQLLKSVQQF